MFPSMKQRGHRDSTQGGRKKHIEALMSEKEWVRVRDRAPGHVPSTAVCSDLACIMLWSLHSDHTIKLPMHTIHQMSITHTHQ